MCKIKFSILIAISLIFRVFLSCGAIENEKNDSLIKSNQLLSENLIYNIFSLPKYRINIDSITNLEGNKLKLTDNLRNVSHNLVLVYSSLGCQLCLSAEVNNIKKLEKNKQDEIIFIFRNMNINEASILSKRYNINERNVFVSNQLFVDLRDEANILHYFTIDSNRNIWVLFIPDKNNPEVATKYLQFVNNLR